MLGLDISVLIVMGATALVSMMAFNDHAFLNKYLFNVGQIHQGEKFRLFTSGFLHADVQHLLFNMITLFFFAGAVEMYLGSEGFLGIYLASLIAGNLLSLYMHKDEPHYSALGASGAVMGIVYSAILLVPSMRIYGFIPGYVFGIGYLLYSIYGMRTRADNLGHDAHFGGAVAGYLITLILKPSLLYNQTLTVLLLAIPIIVLIVLKKMGRI